MASLRRTRRFSSSPTPQEPQQSPFHDIQSYYNDLPISAGSKMRNDSEPRSRSVRKVKSQLAMESSNNVRHGGQEKEGCGPSDFCAIRISPGGSESKVRKKKRGKGVRSQSARRRDPDEHTSTSLQLTASGNDSLRSPTPNPQPFLIPKSKGRSQSRSPSPMPSYLPLTSPEENSLPPVSQNSGPVTVDSRLRSKRRRAATSRSRSGSSSEDGATQKLSNFSRLPTPSRAASPLPPQTPTLNMPYHDISFRAEHSTGSASPAVQASLRAPLLSSLRRETTRNTSSDTSKPLSSRARSQSRASQASPVPIASSQSLAISTPRTLQDVTRHLEETRGRLPKKKSSHAESTVRDVDLKPSQQSSPSATPIPSRSRTQQVELDMTMISPTSAEEPRTLKERFRIAHSRAKHGLAITNEDGHRLGEPTVEQGSQAGHLSPARKGTIPEVTTRHNPVSTHNVSITRPVVALGSGPLNRTIDHSERDNLPTTTLNASGDTQKHWPERVASQHSASLMRGISAKDENIPSREGSRNRLPLTRGTQSEERHERSNRYDCGSRVQRLETNLSNSKPLVTPSALLKPLPKPILVSRQPSIPVRPTLPNAPALRPPRAEKTFSHKPNCSDTSSSSLPRPRKLVIRNPGPSDRASSASSSNLGTPKSVPVASSGEFTVFALSGSQTSMVVQTNGVEYVVPDDVAVEVANDEERRRRALAGLVHDLDLPCGNQVRERPVYPKTRRSRASWSTVVPRRELHQDRLVVDENEEDDDAFFARLSMHDDGRSLLEEPQPEAESGFRNDDDDGFDEENTDFDDDTETEDGEDDEDPPLPPTPKFVHPLGEGDDLESRITRVTSLNRISPTPPSPNSRHRRPEQDCQMSSLLEIPPLWQPSPTPLRREASLSLRTTRNQTVSECVERTSPRESDSETQHFPETNNPRKIHERYRTSLIQEETLFSSQSQASILVSDNGPSSVGDGRLSGADSGAEETLSSGAEALFRQLQVEAEARQAVQLGRDITSSVQSFDTQAETPRASDENPGSQIADVCSTHQNRSATKPHEHFSLSTWRSTLPFGAYDSLAERHGPSEMRRQEIIWELCETEQAFVKSLRLILRLFVQPLRHEDRTWISGVPRDVTRLFDWFDDIMHLHSQISSALHATRSAQYPVVIQVAETLRPYIPRLELHQPYLVRLENVSSAIEIMTKDMRSDFGEFVRIQSASPECESMNLPSFLLKPVQRLMKYPLFFKQLWEFTPRSHPDHLPTFSLLHSTDMIIRVMQEVKTREEEYELVKNLASRIKGLPSGYQLARRERRLIAQGLLRRVILSDKERVELETVMDVHEKHRSRNTSVSSTPSHNSSFTGDWAYHPTGTGNISTSATDRSMQAESITSDVTLDSTTSVSRTNSRSTSRSRSSSLRGTLRQKPKEISIYAFVFTDLMILTTPISERLHLLRSPKNTGDNKETWKLIDDLGVSRVLGVSDHSGKLANHEHLIALELMSMTPNLLDTGTFSDGATATPVYLSVPDLRVSAQETGFDALAEPKAKWLHAFERCFRFTLRSLSFPSYAGSYGSSGGSTDLESDTKSSVMSILSSGLPLPISPSQQLGEAQQGRPSNLVQEEREERGWWSLRFHQVLKEVQRCSRSPVLDTAPNRKSGTRSKRSEPRPLILSPNPLITVPSSRKSGLLSLGRKKSK